jgi:Rrf2 family protein
MQLTRAADYAVRVMVALAREPGEERVLLAELARVTEAPESFLSKVLQALAKAGLIESQRGHAGGFSISPRGRAANMRQVVEALEGPIALNVCVSPEQECSRSPHCPAHPVWARAQRAMLRELEAAKIAAMALERRFVFAPDAESRIVERIAAAGER